MKVLIDVDSDRYEVKLREVDVRDTDYILAKIICQTLIEFKKYSLPPETMTEKEWSLILDKIIYAFQRLSSMDELPEEMNKNIQNKIREGLKLFAKHYSQLWYETIT